MDKELGVIGKWLELIHQAIKDHTESEQKYQQAETSQRQKQTEAELKTVVRLPEEIEEYYRSEQSDRPVNNNRDRIRLLLEGSGVIIALILAALNICALLVLNGQLEEMRKANESATTESRAVRRHARQELRAIQQQAKAAQDSANGIQSQTRTAERAWISPDAFNVVNGVFNARVVADQPFHLRLTFLNTGHTPALKAKFAVITKQVDSKDGKFRLPAFDYKPSDYENIGTILPGGRPFEDRWANLDQSALDGIDKTHRFYVHGRFTYDDVFQVPHWLTFCYFLSPGGAYGICKEHNDIDEDPN
jgi:hypothetical protein